MVQGMLEIVAMCLGLVGLIGAAATTGLPMWKVTAFIGENIIVMETRWEGLWMNCFRQANIRMQCKVYDSLLILPPDLQAARGLMCCSLALAGVGLVIGLAGMRCMSCLQERERARSLVLVSAGVMMLLASLCVFIPVSWTGHVIIRDFYNPLLLDAQRRELGEALYIGWVTGGFLFASGLILMCRRVPYDSDSFDLLQRQNPPLIGYLSPPYKPALIGYQPVVSRAGSIGNQPVPFNGGSGLIHPTPPNGSLGQPISLNTSYTHSLPHFSNLGSLRVPQPSPLTSTSAYVGVPSTPGNSIYIGQLTAPFPPSTGTQRSPSRDAHYPGFQQVRPSPLFVGYHSSKVAPRSPSASLMSEYI